MDYLLGSMKSHTKIFIKLTNVKYPASSCEDEPQDGSKGEKRTRFPGKNMAAK